MTKECIYGFGVNISATFDEAVSDVEQHLNAHGFNVYTRLNMRDIIGGSTKDQLGRYLILGACNPDLAKEIFLADPDIGLLMPCNIIVYEVGTTGCRIMVKDPARIMDLVSNPHAIQAAIKVKEQLEQVIEEIDNKRKS